jgi:hypothetical protein
MQTVSMGPVARSNQNAEQRGRWIYVPYPEEIQVTFQVGMVGTDGILLASDTLCMQGQSPDGSTIRSTYDTPKIQIDDEKGLAFCWAGDELGSVATQLITDKVDATSHGDFKSFLRQSGQLSIIKARKIRESLQSTWRLNNCTVLVVVRIAQSVSLWKLVLIDPEGSTPHIIADPIITKMVTGDQSSPAVFLAERYYPKVRKLPVQDLVPLAAHTVLMASKFSSGVDGLQIALCRPSAFESLSNEKIAALVKHSQAMDSQIAATLGIQDFEP